LEARGWQPYRWEVTNVVKAGSNELEVEVRAVAVGLPPRAAGAAGPRFNDAFVWDGLNWMKKSPRTSRGDAVARSRRGRGPTPPVSGLQGPVRLVAR
jgi:hypothetical protein